MAQSQKMLSRHDYHVAWICPGVEVALLPACLLLDEEHLRPEFDAAYDQNTYQYGTMEGHNVVLATTNSGMRGNVNASCLTYPIFNTFPNIKMTMVVGIGGGIPCESPANDALKDIHLGDVVVGWPSDGKPAVVYYDSGKSLVGGDFEQLGTIDRPDWALLQALGTIQINHQLDTITPAQSPRTHLKANLDRLQRLNSQYAYPGYQHDRLYKPSYNHQGKTGDCTDCENTELVDRTPREEKHQGQLIFHQGRIGTGNSIILDAVRRDKISRENGGLQCIEMSAAGVDVNRNCLVIRGISDYCDSHKGSAWKHYAAASAAAFGRELLRAVQPRNVEGMKVGEKKIGHFMVPLGRNDGFVEREDIVPKLVEKVLPNANREDCQRNAIEGLGGIGKTQIALELAYRVHANFSETSIFWISAMSQATFEVGIRELGKLLKVPGMKEDKSDCRALVKIALEQTADNWILIIDNADDLGLCFDQADGLRLREWLPFNRSGSILFTTRDHEISTRLAILPSHVINLAAMSKAEAIDLLKTNLNESQLRDNQSTEALIEQLAYLPLAIKQASAYMAQTRDSTSTYLRYYYESDQERLELLSRDFEDRGRYSGTKNAITATWLISFEHVSRKRPLAIKYLEFICFLAQKDIPKSLLPPASTEREVNEAVATLEGYAFITRREDGNLLDIHRLVRLAMRNHLQERRLKEATTEMTQHMSRVYPNPKHENRSLWMRYMPHAMAAVEVCKESDDQVAAIEFVCRVAETYTMTGKYEQAEPLIRQALELSEKEHGQHHPKTLATLHELANLIYRQEKYSEAEQIFREVSEIRGRISGQEHPDTLASRHKLAKSMYLQGRFHDAKQIFRKVSEARGRVSGQEHRDTLASRHELAKSMYRQGRFHEAKKILRKVSEARGRASGQAHLDTLASIHKLTKSIFRQGRRRGAKRISWKVSEVRGRVSNQAHLDTLASMHKLAKSIFRQKRREAKRIPWKVSEVRGRVSSQTHLDALASRHELAPLCDNERRYGQAEQMDRNAPAYAAQTGVPDVASVFSFANQLAVEALEPFSAGESPAKRIADLLYNTEGMRALYHQALCVLGQTQFVKVHNGLLKKFFYELRAETINNLAVKVVKHFGTQPQRGFITELLRSRVAISTDQEPKSDHRHMGQAAERKSFETTENVTGQNGTRAEAHIRQDRRSNDSTNDEISTAVELSNVNASNSDRHDAINRWDDQPMINANEEEEEEEEEEEDSASECSQTPNRLPEINLEHLEAVYIFLTQGQAFKVFKSSFNAFVNPPTSIEEALKTGNDEVIEKLLTAHFFQVATGDYEWLKTLKESEYPNIAIARLLIEQMSDSPWIYFSSQTIEPINLQVDAHIAGCVHGIFRVPYSGLQPPTATQLQSDDYHDCLRTVQELCGLAGVVPVSRDQKSWNGIVDFSADDIYTASVSYPSGTRNFPSTVSLLTHILDGLCAALGCFQSCGLCCNSLTVLQCVDYYSPQASQTAPIVELCQIPFRSIISLRELLGSGADTRQLDGQDCALNILSAVFKFDGNCRRKLQKLDNGMILSLTVQFLCISFLSYSQAHIGALKLFFLDTHIEQIRLLGSSAETGKPYIKGHLTELTCMRDMVQSPVFTFSLIDPHEEPTLERPSFSHDMLANFEDLVDTWGDGQFVLPEKENPLPVALIIGGGTIFAVDAESTKFHWSARSSTIGLSGRGIRPQTKIIIGTSGTPISHNEHCPINEEPDWQKDFSHLHLGGYSSYWELDELQVGVQAGAGRFILQANSSLHKIPGRTLKHRILQSPNDGTFVPFLDDYIALQVSFCTGVSKRVALREMVADLLPIFAETQLSGIDNRIAWEKLRDQHQIIEHLRSGQTSAFLRMLPDILAQLAFAMIRDILTTLKETGIDPSGKYMVVAWPRLKDLHYCFRVPCKGESAWTKVLADSEDCATFAYITTRCFQADTFRCQGSGAVWKNMMPLLETAVIGNNSKPVSNATGHATGAISGLGTAPDSPSSSIAVLSPPLDLKVPSPQEPVINLQHKAMHFFQKSDGYFLVKVQRPDTAAMTKLVACNLPSKIFSRLLLVQKGKQSQMRRLRERVRTEDAAELVWLMASSS